MIHRIRIENFKSIDDVTVELSPVTVLVGKSGTGKSNFLHAIRFLRDALRNGSYADFCRERDPSPAANPTALPKFEVEFSVDEFPERFVYHLNTFYPANDPDSPKQEESLALGDHVLFHRRVNKWLTEPGETVVPHPQEFSIRRVRVPEVMTAYTALTTGIGCYVLPPDVLKEQAQNAEQQLGLSDDAANYKDTIQQIAINLGAPQAKQEINAALRILNPSFVSVDIDTSMNPPLPVVGHKVNGKIMSLDLKSESDGFRRFYAHLLALYQVPSKQTLLFEEPENGIYPGALAMLTEDFKAAPESGRGQVILTTHSPELLDHFSPDEIRVVQIEKFKTQIGKINEGQSDSVKRRLLEPGELLTVDPARMEEASAG